MGAPTPAASPETHATPSPAGPPPEPFRFPFGPAQMLRDAAGEAHRRLSHLFAQHETAAGRARLGFRGQARQRFDHRLRHLSQRLKVAQGRLSRQLDALDAALHTARTRRRQSRQAREAWRRRARVTAPPAAEG